MSEIYKALRDAERHKGATPPLDTIRTARDAPRASVSGSPLVEASSENGPSLIRGVRERLEWLKAESPAATRADQRGLTVLTLSGAASTRQDAPGQDRVSPRAVTPPKEGVPVELLRELAALEGRFLGLAERLSGAVDGLRAGRPPGGDLSAELTACETDFDTLRKQVAALLPGPSVLAETATSPSATLNDLLTVLQATLELDNRRREFDEVRRRAVAELEHILRLVHRDGAAFPPLEQCQNKAREWLDQFDRAEWPDLPAECTLLAERRHAFSRLLDLVEHADGLSDADWEAAEEAVTSSFGKPLAIAVNRGRLRLEAGATGA